MAGPSTRGGWTGRPLSFNEIYTIDLNWLLTVEADACTMTAGAGAMDGDNRAVVHAVNVQAIPQRIIP